MKLLKLAISDQRWDVAAHTLIIGLLRAKHKENNPHKIEGFAEVPLHGQGNDPNLSRGDATKPGPPSK